MTEYEDFTTAYKNKPLTMLEGLKQEGYLFIGELLTTEEGRVLIPIRGHEGNLFPVFLATYRLTLVGEFPSYEDAALFLRQAEVRGWEAVWSEPYLSGINWLAGEKPDFAEMDFPWIQNEFPHWLNQMPAA